MTCTSCGHDLPPVAKFCPECGAPRSASRVDAAGGVFVSDENHRVQKFVYP